MKQKISTYFKNQKLSTKMLLIYIILFGAFTVISMLSHQITLNIYDDQIYEKALLELNYFAKAIDEEIDVIEKVSFRIASDYEVQRSLPIFLEGPVNQSYIESRSNIKSKLLSEALASENIMSILYTHESVAPIGPMGNFYTQLSEDMTEELEGMAREANGACVYIYPTKEFPYIVSAREVRKHVDYSLESLGILTFISDFEEIINNNQPILNNGDSQLSILYGGAVIYGEDITPVLDDSDLQGERGYKIINLDGEKQFVCYLRGSDENWVFINMFPYSSIFYLNTIVRTAMMILFVFLFISAYFILRKTSKVVTEPLEKLSSAMKLVESGHFQDAKEQLILQNTQDEIGVLEKNFKIMLEKIILLIYENYEKQLILKDTQYRMLQAQINPHFLYNTLNSINWMIRAERNEEASQMIISLGELLRSAFKKSTWATVDEELELLESYIDIQKMRYKARADFEISVQGNMEPFMLPRMILQPIVENAINYAVDASINHHVIKVSLIEKGKELHIRVKDDGPGIEKEYLEKINTFEMEPRGSGIGLKNIRQRLELLFNKDFVFSIESEIGVGTSVSIIVPQRGAESDVESSNN